MLLKFSDLGLQIGFSLFVIGNEELALHVYGRSRALSSVKTCSNKNEKTRGDVT